MVEKSRLGLNQYRVVTRGRTDGRTDRQTASTH